MEKDGVVGGKKEMKEMREGWEHIQEDRKGKGRKKERRIEKDDWCEGKEESR